LKTAGVFCKNILQHIEIHTIISISNQLNGIGAKIKAKREK